METLIAAQPYRPVRHCISGRGDRIRTCDPHTPSLLLCQRATLSGSRKYLILKGICSELDSRSQGSLAPMRRFS